MNCLKLAVFIFFLVTHNVLYSQVETKTLKLQRFADEKALEWQNKRAEAESLAIEYNFIIKGENEDGPAGNRVTEIFKKTFYNNTNKRYNHILPIIF